MKTNCKHVKILMTENQSGRYELKQAGNQEEKQKEHGEKATALHRRVRWRRAGREQ